MKPLVASGSWLRKAAFRRAGRSDLRLRSKTGAIKAPGVVQTYPPHPTADKASTAGPRKLAPAAVAPQRCSAAPSARRSSSYSRGAHSTSPAPPSPAADRCADGAACCAGSEVAMQHYREIAEQPEGTRRERDKERLSCMVRPVDLIRVQGAHNISTAGGTSSATGFLVLSTIPGRHCPADATPAAPRRFALQLLPARRGARRRPPVRRANISSNSTSGSGCSSCVMTP